MAKAEYGEEEGKEQEMDEEDGSCWEGYSDRVHELEPLGEMENSRRKFNQ